MEVWHSNNLFHKQDFDICMRQIIATIIEMKQCTVIGTSAVTVSIFGYVLLVGLQCPYDVCIILGITCILILMLFIKAWIYTLNLNFAFNQPHDLDLHLLIIMIWLHSVGQVIIIIILMTRISAECKTYYLLRRVGVFLYFVFSIFNLTQL